MDIINKTARYIYTSYGGSDYQEKTQEYSGLVAYIMDERIDLVHKVLKYTLEQLNEQTLKGE